jgi:hypothetical protein
VVKNRSESSETAWAFPRHSQEENRLSGGSSEDAIWTLCSINWTKDPDAELREMDITLMEAFQMIHINPGQTGSTSWDRRVLLGRSLRRFSLLI